MTNNPSQDKSELNNISGGGSPSLGGGKPPF